MPRPRPSRADDLCGRGPLILYIHPANDVATFPNTQWPCRAQTSTVPSDRFLRKPSYGPTPEQTAAFVNGQLKNRPGPLPSSFKQGPKPHCRGPNARVLSCATCNAPGPDDEHAREAFFWRGGPAPPPSFCLSVKPANPLLEAFAPHRSRSALPANCLTPPPPAPDGDVVARRAEQNVRIRSIFICASRRSPPPYF